MARVEWTKDVPTRLYPFHRQFDKADSKIIAIDPSVSFGKPFLTKHGISTSIIVNRYDVGESIDDLSEDYGLDKSDIEAAILYERAA